MPIYVLFYLVDVCVCLSTHFDMLDIAKVLYKEHEMIDLVGNCV